jgi:hypothetical protein
MKMNVVSASLLSSKHSRWELAPTRSKRGSRGMGADVQVINQHSVEHENRTLLSSSLICGRLGNEQYAIIADDSVMSAYSSLFGSLWCNVFPHEGFCDHLRCHAWFMEATLDSLLPLSLQLFL